MTLFTADPTLEGCHVSCLNRIQTSCKYQITVKYIIHMALILYSIKRVFFKYFYRYRLELDSESAHWGYMSCKMTGTYVGKLVLVTITSLLSLVAHKLFLNNDVLFPTGHHNLSYILDNDFGR